MSKKTILVISRIFPPSESIGAVRPYNLAKHLSESGHQVFCVVEGAENRDYTDGMVCISEISARFAGNLRKKRANHVSQHSNLNDSEEYGPPRRKIGALTDCKRIVRQWLSQILFLCSEFEWAADAAAKAASIVKSKGCQIVITSYGPVSSVVVGMRLKKCFPQLFWVSDLRDPLDSMHQKGLVRRTCLYVQRKMVCSADAITTVCHALREKYTELVRKNSRWECPVYTIENGYEPSPVKQFPKKDSILRIAYTGQLYNGIRDMSFLFKAVSEIEEKRKGKIPLEIHYAGPNGSALFSQAKPFRAEKYIIDHGMLKKSEALILQESCDVLCVLTWNTSSEQGVLTGKFPEYLRLKKPVVAIVSGDRSGAELTIRINELRIGYSCEHARGDESYIGLVKWMENALDQKEKNGVVTVNCNSELIEEYSYPVLMQKYEQMVLHNL